LNIIPADERSACDSFSLRAGAGELC